MSACRNNSFVSSAELLRTVVDFTYAFRAVVLQ